MKILKIFFAAGMILFNLHGLAFAGERSNTHYQYNAKGQLESTDDPNQNRTNYSYDTLGRLEFVLTPDSSTTEYKYDANGNLIDTFADTYGLHLNTHNTYNARNELEKVDYPDGRSIKYGYDANGNQERVEEIGGGVWTMTFDELNRMSRRCAPGYSDICTNPNSPDTTYEQFSYYKNSLLYASIDRKDNTTENFYDGNNRLTKVIHPIRTEETNYTYDDVGNLETVTDPRGKITKYFYDEMNRVFQTVDPHGHTTEYGYDFNSNVTSIQDTKGVNIFKTYTPQNQVSTVYDDQGATTTYQYDLAGNLVTLYEPPNPSETQGRVTEYLIDEMNRVQGIKRDNVLVEEYAFDKIGNRTSRKLYPEAGGTALETQYEYNIPARIVKVTPPPRHGSQAVYTFDQVGDLTRHQAGANLKTYTYDDLHRVDTKTVNGRLYDFGYDSNSNLTSAAFPFLDGTMTETFTHDELDRVKEERYVKDAFDVKVDYNQYDAGGNLVKMTGPEGDVWDFTPDDANRVTGVTKNSQPLAGIGYEDNDLVKSMTYAGNAQFGTFFTHDALNRLKTIIFQKPGGGQTAGNIIDQMDYDYYYDRNIKSIIENAGTQTIQYDDFNRLRTVVDTRGGVTKTYSFDFDNIGNRENIDTPPNGGGAMASETGGKFPQNEVSDNGVLALLTYPKRMHSDEYNDKIVVDVDVSWPLSPMGRGQVRFNKTDQSNFLQVNLRRDLGIVTLEEVIDGVVTELDRVNNVSIPAGEIIKITGRAEGNTINVDITSRDGKFELGGQATVPFTGFVSYHADDTLMRVVRSEVSLQGEMDSGWQIVNGQWDLEGSYLKGTANPPEPQAMIRRGEAFWKDMMVDSFISWPQEPDGVAGILVNMQDDQNYVEVQLNQAADQLRILEVTGGITSELARQDNLIIPADENVNVYVESLGQDIRVLLVSSAGIVELSGTLASQTAGLIGYRTTGLVKVESTEIRAAVTTTYSYDDIARLAGKVVKQFGDQTLEDVSYTYDEDGRIKAITSNLAAGAAENVEYWYDAFGRRIAKKVGNDIQYSVYAGPNVIQTYNVDGENTAAYQTFTTMGLDNHLAMEVDGQEYFYMKDHLGSVRYLVDAQGNVKNQYNYDPFGNDLDFTSTQGGAGLGAGPEVPNPFKYTGREYDPESGLYNYRMRYYNPLGGRFTSVDPVESAGEGDFAYVSGDPINATDPWGLRVELNWKDKLEVTWSLVKGFTMGAQEGLTNTTAGALDNLSFGVSTYVIRETNKSEKLAKVTQLALFATPGGVLLDLQSVDPESVSFKIGGITEGGIEMALGVGFTKEALGVGSKVVVREAVKKGGQEIAEDVGKEFLGKGLRKALGELVDLTDDAVNMAKKTVNPQKVVEVSRSYWKKTKYGFEVVKSRATWAKARTVPGTLITKAKQGNKKAIAALTFTGKRLTSGVIKTYRAFTDDEERDE